MRMYRSRRELPTSRVAGGISMGLNSPRPEGTLSFMLNHPTLRMQARMKQYAIRPFSLLSASEQCNMLGEIIKFRSLSSTLSRKGSSRSQVLNNSRTSAPISIFNSVHAILMGYAIVDNMICPILNYM